MLLIWISLCALLCISTRSVYGQCYQSMYGRGAGKPISSCKDDEDKDGALCYPDCKDGYFGNGPMCYEACKDPYTNTGLTCFRSADTYGNKCSGNCKHGYHNTGCTCLRYADSYSAKSYGRGAGKPLSCKSDETMEGALCYPKCKSGYKEWGLFCWIDGCNGAYEHSCKLEAVCTQLFILTSPILTPVIAAALTGVCMSKGLMCTKDTSQCANINLEIASQSFAFDVSLALIVFTAG